MRVTSIQLEMKDQSKELNLATVRHRLDEAPASDLILLPELWPSGFFCFDRYAEESEPVDGPLIQALREKAVALKIHLLIGSFVEKEADNLFNTALVIDPQGEIIAKYRKIHLFGYQSDEKRLLTAGDQVTVFDLPWGKAGITTCYDLRFPELYRLMMDRGAQFFLIPSAWPKARLAAWRLFNQARAHENLAYLISCNCAGQNVGATYAGHSMIVSPLGDIIAEGGETGDLVSADIDPDLVLQVRQDFSALDDRIYTTIEKP